MQDSVAEQQGHAGPEAEPGRLGSGCEGGRGACTLERFERAARACSAAVRLTPFNVQQLCKQPAVTFRAVYAEFHQLAQ